MAKETIDLGFATKLEPENIVSYFNSKGLENTFGWTDMLDKDHAKSFTIAKVMNMDLLQDMRGLVANAIQEGETIEDFKKSFMDKMLKKGWWDSDASGEVVGISRRLDTILRTNSQSAYMAGKYNTFVGDVGERPYLQYLAVMDASTRPSHAAMHGKIYRYDDPFWSYFYPPNGFRCRCHVRSLSDLDIKDMGIDVTDSGDAVSVEEEELDNGNTIKTGVFKLDDGTVFKTDKGWGYNSGKESYDLFFKKYDQDIFDVGQKAINGFIDGYLRTRYPELTLDEIASMRKGFFAGLYQGLNVSDETVRAVHQYKGSGYIGINTKLRGYNGDLDKIKEVDPDSIAITNINGLDQIFKNKTIVTDRNIKVYRGFGIHKEDADFWDIYKNLKAGDKFTDHGFVSTSYRSDIHKGFAVGTKDYNVYEIEINLPKGSKAINVQTFLVKKVNEDYKESEFELLLNRGIEFKVNNVIVIDDNHKIIQVEALL